MPNYFNTSLKNLVYRLRKFKSVLDLELKNEILRHEDVIIKMITQEQLYEKGIEGRGIEISSYNPYKTRTIKKDESNTSRGLICKLSGFEKGILSEEDIKKDLEDKLNMDLTDEEIEEFIKTVMEY